MQKINQFQIFEFGAKFRSFIELPDKATLFQVAGPLFALKEVLSELKQGNPIYLSYSMGNIQKALQTLNSIEKINFLDKNGEFDFDKDWSQTASDWLIASAKADLARLEHTLAAEFERTATYLVGKTTIFDTETLIDHAATTLTSEVRELLPTTAIQDFEQAGRCLGFGLYTAAGFHTARATEAVMLSYCDTFKGCLGESDRQTWGQLLNALTRYKGSPKPEKSTIAILEQIKNVDRNELMHPRKTLDLTEATRLFHLATGVIIAMAMEMRANGNIAEQGQLFDTNVAPPLIETAQTSSAKANNVQT